MATRSLDPANGYRSRRYADELTRAYLIGTVLVPAATAVVCFFWLWVYGQRLDGPHFLLGLLACIAVGEIAYPRRRNPGGPVTVTGLASITWRWLLVAFVLAAGIKLAGMTDRLNLAVLEAAGLTIPFAVWAVAAGASIWPFSGARARSRHRKCVVVGLTNTGVQWIRRLESDPALGIDVVGVFDDRQAAGFMSAVAAPHKGCVDDVAAFVRDNQIDFVYIALPMSRDESIVRLVEALADSTASTYFVPDIFAFNSVQARVDCVHGIPLVAVYESPIAGAAALAKRAIDLAISVPALALVIVPMLAVAAAIRMTSNGPAIFRQKRYGLDGEPIVIYKFRTMTVVEDGDTKYKQVERGDVRVTRIGAWLRKFSLDELPQLLNVLEGSMSIVGPRPHAVRVNEHYRKLIPSYMLRHKVKPGITGLAQVLGYRGGDDLESMTKRIECDLAYLRNWTLNLDLQLISRTINVIWRDRNAF